MNVIICRPATWPLRRIVRCPTCKRRRRFSGLDAAWYGAIWTCCGCGDSWGEGGRMRRPARRGWRTEAKRKAKQVWIDAGGRTHEEFEAWFRAELGNDEPQFINEGTESA